MTSNAHTSRIEIMSHRKKVIIHIGMYKTGTTSIQMTLCGNEERLFREGILYPKTGRPSRSMMIWGHHLIARAVRSKDIAATDVAAFDIFQSLKLEIDRSTSHTVILSSEEFCSLKILEPLVNLLSEYEVTIVGFVRPQDDFLNAMYYTYISSKSIFLDPLEYATGNVKSLLDYNELFSIWRTAFPNATIKVVALGSRGSSDKFNSVFEFLRICGIEELSLELAEDMRAHPTLPANGVAVLQELARIGVTREAFYRIFKLLHAVYSDLDTQKYSYSPSFRKSLIDTYEESNKILRVNFMDGIQIPLFEQPIFETDESWSQSFYKGEWALVKILDEIATKNIGR